MIPQSLVESGPERDSPTEHSGGVPAPTDAHADTDSEEKSSESLPSPKSRPGSDVVIYDGHCQFCTAGVKSLSRFDLQGRLSYLSLHSDKVHDLVPDLSRDDLMDEMVVVQPDGTRHGGADAVRYLSRRLPLLWWAAPILHVPGTARGWRWLYRQVARRRYQLAGKTCDSGSCQLHNRH